MSAGTARWELLEWFGEVTGIKNVGPATAEDVVIHTGDNVPLERDAVEAGEEVTFSCQNQYVSISWHDSAGMNSDIVRLKD